MRCLLLLLVLCSNILAQGPTPNPAVSPTTESPSASFPPSPNPSPFSPAMSPNSCPVCPAPTPYKCPEIHHHHHTCQPTHHPRPKH